MVALGCDRAGEICKMRIFRVVVLGLAMGSCAFLISGITSAYSGTFYTTGKEFYEGCWQRKTKDEA